jgi:hypothetical protein
VGASGFVASLCGDTLAPAIQGVIDKLDAQLNAQCLKTILNPDPTTHAVDCLVEESFATDYGSKTRCEDIGGGYCTPGSAPCRVAGSSHPPVDVPTAAAGLVLPIGVTFPDGTRSQRHCPAYAQNGNVYVGGGDDPLAATDGCGTLKHLVCEVHQLNDDARCLNDKTYTIDPATGGGWCYSTNADVVGPACLKIGAPGTLRFLGGAVPKDGSEEITVCHDPTCSGGC